MSHDVATKTDDDLSSSCISPCMWYIVLLHST